MTTNLTNPSNRHPGEPAVRRDSSGIYFQQREKQIPDDSASRVSGMTMVGGGTFVRFVRFVV